MKALVLRAPNAPFELCNVPDPTPGPGEAVARVLACGSGLTIQHIKAGRVKVPFPRIIGHEITGEIVALGAGASGVAVGDAVTAYYYLNCGHCRNCLSQFEPLCENLAGQIGRECDGGYAEYIALPERNVVPIPDGVSDVEAAVASDAIATPYHACHEEARVGPGDSVLIIGAGGGVGIHMVQMARLCGGRVLAADIGDDKLALAKQWGADEVIDARSGDLAKQVMALTDGRGANACIDIVGNKQSLEAGLQSLAMLGRLVIIGAKPKSVYKDDPSFSIDPGYFLHRGLELHSSRYVNAAEIAQTLELVRRKRITPVITRTFALEEVETAHELIRNNQTTGRIALVF